MVVELVVVHTCLLAPCRLRSIDLHLCDPVKLICALVEDIRNIILRFRNDADAGAVLELLLGGICIGRSLIHILECPDGDTAVNNILTVVTGIVPAA